MRPNSANHPKPNDGALWKRVASAVVLAPAAIGALYAGGAVFASVVAFAAIVMVFEWTRMIEARDFSPSFFALSVAGAIAFMLAGAGAYSAAFVSCAVGAALAALLTMRGSRRQAWIAFGAFYILAPCTALIWLRNDLANGRALVLMLFLIVWSADTGAFFAGRLVGGPKMSPAISPAKTWAGAIGGLALGAMAGLAAARWVWGDDGGLGYALIGASLGLASILGDMAESAFKRVCGVKDASGFIPGHGGALDRLDGMIFATTAMSIVLYGLALIGRA